MIFEELFGLWRSCLSRIFGLPGGLATKRLWRLQGHAGFHTPGRGLETPSNRPKNFAPTSANSLWQEALGGLKNWDEGRSG